MVRDTEGNLGSGLYWDTLVVPTENNVERKTLNTFSFHSLLFRFSDKGKYAGPAPVEINGLY